MTGHVVLTPSGLSSVGVALVVMTLFPAVAFADRPDIQTIIEALKTKEARVRTASIKWEEHATLTKGSLFDPANFQRADANVMALPAHDVTQRFDKTLMIDGDSMAYTIQGPGWDPVQSAFVTRRQKSSFNGSSSTIYWAPTERMYGVGTIRTEKYNIDVADYHTTAVLLSFRTFHSAMGGLKASRMTLKDAMASIDSQACALVEEVSARTVRNLWLDPSQEYSIRRYSVSVDGKTRLQIDITNTKHASHGWIPTSWKIVRQKADGTLNESCTATVNEVSINRSIDKKEVDIIFPVGTRVRDRTTNCEYIVREGGRKRIITVEEAGAPYESLLTSDTGMAVPHSRSGWIYALMCLAAVGIVASSALFVWKHVRSRKNRVDKQATVS